MLTVAVNGTCPSTVQSVCARPWAVPTVSPAGVVTFIGKTASKYHVLGAFPEIVKVWLTIAPDFGELTETFVSKGGVDGFVDVSPSDVEVADQSSGAEAEGALAAEGVMRRSHAKTAMTTRRAAIMTHQSRVLIRKLYG